MKEFFKTRIRWKVFAKEMIIIFAFFSFSYWIGNNKFPHKVWIVPVATLIIGFVVLFHAYLNDEIKKEKEKRNGKV